LESGKQKCEGELSKLDKSKTKDSDLEQKNQKAGSREKKKWEEEKQQPKTKPPTDKEKEKEINLLLIGVALVAGTICLIFVCCWRHAASKQSQLQQLLDQMPKERKEDKKLKRK